MTRSAAVIVALAALAAALVVVGPLRPVVSDDEGAAALGASASTDSSGVAVTDQPERVASLSGDRVGQPAVFRRTLNRGAAGAGSRLELGDREQAVVLRGVGPDDHYSVRLAAAEGWGPWLPLEYAPDEAPDGEPGAEGGPTAEPATTGLVWLGPGAKTIEITNNTHRSEDADHVPASAGVVEVLTIDPGDGPDLGPTPAPAVTEVAAGAPAGPRILPVGSATAGLAARATRPAIQARSAWTDAGWSAGGEGCGSGPSTSDNLAALVIHHTVNANTYAADQVDDLLRSIHTLHVKINGWCDIGYNFVVDRFGRIWEARTNSLDAPVIGGHAKGFNTSTLGVAMLGQHQPGVSPAAARPSDAVRAAILALAAWKLEPYGVDPLGRTWLYNHATGPPVRLAAQRWHYVPTIVGHRNLGLTSCPGDYGMELVAGLPSALAADRDLTVPLRFDGWTPRSHGPGFVTINSAGGLRPSGTAAAVDRAPSAPVSPTSAIAVDGDHSGGYILYTDGTLRPFGNRPDVAGTPAGTRSVVDLEVAGNGGWVLATGGAVAAFGDAPAITGAVVDGSARAVALSIDPDSGDRPRGYVVDTTGRLQALGDAPDLPAVAVGSEVVDLALRWSQGRAEGYVVDRAGRVAGVGLPDPAPATGGTAPVAIVVSPLEPGAWVVDATGAVWPVGGARRVLPISTDTANASVVDGAQLGHLIPDSFLAGADSRYIDGLYRLLVGRAAGPAEIERRVALLEDGAKRRSIVEPLVTSPHWIGSVVDQMYRDVLGRAPDAEGRAYWIDRVADGMTYRSLGIFFYGSGEYAQRAGSNRDYVRSLYRLLLHRAPDAEGLDYWTSVLDSGRAWPPDVVYGFYVSPESRRDRVVELYRRILGREPSEAEVVAGVAALKADDDVTLATDLVASAEFYLQAVDH